MRHLGAAIGSSSFKDNHVKEKIAEWVASVERLAKIAVTEPRAAFSAFIQRLQSRWVFVVRTVPSLANAMQPLEDAIRQKFLPALLGRQVSDIERELFSFPARFCWARHSESVHPMRETVQGIRITNSTAACFDLGPSTKDERKEDARSPGLHSGIPEESSRGSIRRTTSQYSRQSSSRAENCDRPSMRERGFKLGDR